MRVFVAGGTGAIGRPAVDALIEAGHDVTALARTAAKAARLRAKGAAPVEVSLFDRARLAEALASHDAVVNLATALPRTHRFVSMRRGPRTTGSAQRGPEWSSTPPWR